MGRRALFALCCLALAVLAPALPAQARPPFGPGEKLSYEIYWTFVHAGSATLEVLPPTRAEGRPALHIRALARSTPFVDRFYRVRDMMQSWIDPQVTRTLLYQKDQAEGDYVRHYLVRFNAEGTMAFRYSRGRFKNAVAVPRGSFDPLAMLFLFRTRALAPGYAFAAPVTDGKKSVIGRARVLRREVVRTPAGTFDTFVVQPEVREIGGVFRKSPHATLTVWITADARRIPVRVRSKVVVGYFSMVLTGYEPPTIR